MALQKNNSDVFAEMPFWSEVIYMGREINKEVMYMAKIYEPEREEYVEHDTVMVMLNGK